MLVSLEKSVVVLFGPGVTAVTAEQVVGKLSVQPRDPAGDNVTVSV